MYSFHTRTLRGNMVNIKNNIRQHFQFRLWIKHKENKKDFIPILQIMLVGWSLEFCWSSLTYILYYFRAEFGDQTHSISRRRTSFSLYK